MRMKIKIKKVIRLTDTWRLIRACWHILRNCKKLLVFPFFSGVCCLMLVAFFFFPLIDPAFQKSIHDVFGGGQELEILSLSIPLLSLTHVRDHFLQHFHDQLCDHSAKWRISQSIRWGKNRSISLTIDHRLDFDSGHRRSFVASSSAFGKKRGQLYRQHCHCHSGGGMVNQ